MGESVALARDPWTRSTRLSIGLPDDWDEAYMALKEVELTSQEDVDCNHFGVRTDPHEIAKAKAWAKNITDDDLIIAYRNRFNH